MAITVDQKFLLGIHFSLVFFAYPYMGLHATYSMLVSHMSQYNMLIIDCNETSPAVYLMNTLPVAIMYT